MPLRCNPIKALALPLHSHCKQKEATNSQPKELPYFPQPNDFRYTDMSGPCIMQGGAVVYAMRIPERWKPGAFDIAFHSHQLFHIAVIIAALVHYRVSSCLLKSAMAAESSNVVLPMHKMLRGCSWHPCVSTSSSGIEESDLSGRLHLGG